LNAADLLDRLGETDDAVARRRALTAWLGDAEDPDELLGQLKAQSELYWSRDPRISLRLAEALVDAADVANRPEHRALGLMAKGDSLRYLARYRESASFLAEAADAFAALGNQVGWARTRIGWLVTAHLLGRGSEALADAARAHDILSVNGEWLRAAGLSLNAGWVHTERGEYESAMNAYERAIGLYARAREADASLSDLTAIRSAKAMANKAMVMGWQGDLRAALVMHQEARAQLLQHGDRVAALRQDDNIAQVYLSQGQYAQALRLLGNVLVEAERLDLDETGWVALDMSACYLRLNRDDDALQFAERALARFVRGGTSTEAAKARAMCALAHARLGHLDRALELLAEAAPILEAAGLMTQLGIIALQRAGLHLDAADPHAAGLEADHAEKLFEERGLEVHAATARLLGARAALALGQPERAERLARAALATARQRGARWLEPDGHHLLGRVAMRCGRDEAALASFEAAVLSVEQVQAPIAADLRTAFLTDKLHVYEDAIDCCLRTGALERAFDYLERAKSRTLFEYLARTPGVRVRAHTASARRLADEVAGLRHEHHGLYDRLFGNPVTRRSTPELTQDQTERLQTLIRERERQISHLLDRLSLEDEEVWPAPHRPHHPASLPTMPGGTVLVEFYLRRDSGVAFVVSDTGLTIEPLSVGTNQVGTWLRRWRLNLESTAAAIAWRAPLDALERNAQGLLATLYRALIGPLAAHLGDRTRLIVIPYGPLHEVPFHALHDGDRYLLEAYEVSTCPSSSLLQLLTQRPAGPPLSALVVAHTDGGRLPGTLREAQAIASALPSEVLVEDAATVEAVTRAASRHPVVHLAAHGEARLDNPTFAHIKLAGGRLGASDVFNLELEGALVVLSACESGQGVVKGGDEVVGLSRGFLFAGARAMVQSLWRVDDASTARLMIEFYRGLRAGRPVASALRAAQRGLLDEGSSHPYIWAPFIAVGHVGKPPDVQPVAAVGSRAQESLHG
jgi:CHAT domain-containing protein